MHQFVTIGSYAFVGGCIARQPGRAAVREGRRATRSSSTASTRSACSAPASRRETIAGAQAGLPPRSSTPTSTSARPSSGRARSCPPLPEIERFLAFVRVLGAGRPGVSAALPDRRDRRRRARAAPRAPPRGAPRRRQLVGVYDADRTRAARGRGRGAGAGRSTTSTRCSARSRRSRSPSPPSLHAEVGLRALRARRRRAHGEAARRHAGRGRRADRRRRAGRRRQLQVGHIERFNRAVRAAAPRGWRIPRYIESQRLAPYPAARHRRRGRARPDDPRPRPDPRTSPAAPRPPTCAAIGVAVLSPHLDMANARVEFPAARWPTSPPRGWRASACGRLRIFQAQRVPLARPRRRARPPSCGCAPGGSRAPGPDLVGRRGDDPARGARGRRALARADRASSTRCAASASRGVTGEEGRAALDARAARAARSSRDAACPAMTPAGSPHLPRRASHPGTCTGRRSSRALRARWPSATHRRRSAGRGWPRPGPACCFPMERLQRVRHRGDHRRRCPRTSALLRPLTARVSPRGGTISYLPDRLSRVPPARRRGGARGRHPGAVLHRAAALGLAPAAGAAAGRRGGPARGGAAVRAGLLRGGRARGRRTWGIRCSTGRRRRRARPPAPRSASRAGRAGAGALSGQPRAGSPEPLGDVSAVRRPAPARRAGATRSWWPSRRPARYPDPGPARLRRRSADGARGRRRLPRQVGHHDAGGGAGRRADGGGVPDAPAHLRGGAAARHGARG